MYRRANVAVMEHVSPGNMLAMHKVLHVRSCAIAASSWLLKDPK
jgi:hypothetical protein